MVNKEDEKRLSDIEQTTLMIFGLYNQARMLIENDTQKSLNAWGELSSLRAGLIVQKQIRAVEARKKREGR